MFITKSQKNYYILYNIIYVLSTPIYRYIFLEYQKNNNYEYIEGLIPYISTISAITELNRIKQKSQNECKGILLYRLLNVTRL